MRKALPDLSQRPLPHDDTTSELCATILAFLAADDERFARFLSLTGLSAGDLREAAGSAGFGEGLLDYMRSDDALLLAFARTQGIDPGRIDAMLASPISKTSPHSRTPPHPKTPPFAR